MPRNDPPSEQLRTLGQALALLRQRAGYADQKGFARKMKVSGQRVSQLEKGVNVQYETLADVLEATGNDFCDLEHALREVRGEETEHRPRNGTPAPDFPGLTRDARDLVDREVDRRVARIIMYMRDHDPAEAEGGRQGEPARGQG